MIVKYSHHTRFIADIILITVVIYIANGLIFYNDHNQPGDHTTNLLLMGSASSLPYFCSLILLKFSKKSFLRINITQRVPARTNHKNIWVQLIQTIWKKIQRNAIYFFAGALSLFINLSLMSTMYISLKYNDYFILYVAYAIISFMLLSNRSTSSMNQSSANSDFKLEKIFEQKYSSWVASVISLSIASSIMSLIIIINFSDVKVTQIKEIDKIIEVIEVHEKRNPVQRVLQGYHDKEYVRREIILSRPVLLYNASIKNVIVTPYIVLVLFLLISYVNVRLQGYRITAGYYGFNAKEFLEIVEFMLRNKRNEDFDGGPGRSRRILGEYPQESTQQQRLPAGAEIAK